MKKFYRALLAMMVCLALFFTGIGEVLAAKTIELSFVGDWPDRHPAVRNALIPWFNSLEEMSDGRIKIHYYPPNTLVPQRDGYEATISGMVDMFGAPNLYTVDRFPELALMTLPFVAPSAEAAGLVAMELANRFPIIKERFADTKLLGFWAGATLQFHTTKKLVKTLDDLKGLRIIGVDANSQREIQALGANPIAMIPPDIYMALQRGTADGVLFPLAPIRSLKISDVSKYHTIVDMIVGPFYLVMNKERFSSLPDDIQKMIEETSGEKLCRKVGQIIDQAAIADAKWMKENGHSFYKLPEAELQKWSEKLSPEVNKILTEAEDKVPNAREIYHEAQRLGKEIGKTTGRGYE